MARGLPEALAGQYVPSGRYCPALIYWTKFSQSVTNHAGSCRPGSSLRMVAGHDTIHTGEVAVSGQVSNAALLKVLRNMLNATIAVRLFKNDVVLSPTTTLADLTQATFPGYADATINPGMSVPVESGGQQAITLSDTITWTRGAGPGSETIYGYAVILTDTDGTTYFGAEKINPPRVIDTPLQRIQLRVGMIATSAV